MCVVSNVHDHFNPLFPPIVPTAAPSFDPTTLQWPIVPAPDLTEMRKLIYDFKEAVAAAQKLDMLMKQPDCVDPDKAKLQERVARLEKVIDALLDKRAAL